MFAERARWSARFHAHFNCGYPKRNARALVRAWERWKRFRIINIWPASFRHSHRPIYITYSIFKVVWSWWHKDDGIWKVWRFVVAFIHLYIAIFVMRITRNIFVSPIRHGTPSGRRIRRLSRRLSGAHRLWIMLTGKSEQSRHECARKARSFH